MQGSATVGSLDDGLDLVFNLLHLLMEGTIRVSQNSGSHDVAGDATRLSKIGLLGHVDVDDVLIKSKAR